METKKKNYSKRAKVYRTTGLGVIGLTTTSGFVAYQMAIDWNNFEEEITNFIVIHEQSMKLNLTLAIPFLVGMLVFLWIAMKKNKEFFKDKMSLNILFVLFLLYLVYSVIEVTMVALAGAFVGTMIDETFFLPMSKKCTKLAGDEEEMDKEYHKEKKRIKARSRAESELDGSV